MNEYYLMLTLTWCSASLPLVAGIWHFPALDKASWIFFLLMWLALITEIVGFATAVSAGNNMSVYNVSNWLQTLLICLYFQETIRYPYRRWGLHLGIASLLIGIVIALFLQPIDQMNTFFTNYQMFLIIILSLWFFQQYLNPSSWQYRTRRSVHFWFIFLLANASILNFLITGLYDFLLSKWKGTAPVVNVSLVAINVLYNMGCAAIFFLYPKINKDYAR